MYATLKSVYPNTYIGMLTAKKLSFRFALIPIFLTILIISIVRKTMALSAGPSKDKDCHLLYPFNTFDPSKTTHIVIENENNLPFLQKGGVINDISCLNATQIYGLVKIEKEEDIRNAILFANDHSYKLSLSGVRHSMGGQAFFKDAVILDMTHFKQMSVDEKTKTLRVQSGATWHDIQKYLHSKGLAVKAMQSSDIFTVGGSISVNAHGMDHHVGSLGSTVRSMRIMLSDGTIREVSKTQNRELYSLVIGGYGLFGVILEAELDITDNEMYERETKIIPYREFPTVFEDSMALGNTYGLLFGHLSTGPREFLKEVILYRYKKTDVGAHDIPALQERNNVALKRFFLNLGKTGSVGRQVRYWAEKYLQPHVESCFISRNAALSEGEACLVSRNQEMHESGAFLRNSIKNDTDILQEYFIPRNAFVIFVDGMREVLERNNAVVLNAGIRVVNKEDIFLNYATEDMFAMVLYLNQKTTPEDTIKMEKLTKELVDLAISLGGKPYLPYQLYFTKDQLHQAYPNIDEFFASKKKYDPKLIFMNKMYEKYGKVN